MAQGTAMADPGPSSGRRRPCDPLCLGRQPGADPQFLSDNALNALLRAAYLAPQATQIRISATLMMMAREQFDDAIALLSSITATPRDPASTQVPALLEQARARRKPDMAAIIASFRYTATWRDLNCC
jgi:hypothetical protein